MSERDRYVILVTHSNGTPEAFIGTHFHADVASFIDMTNKQYVRIWDDGQQVYVADLSTIQSVRRLSRIEEDK